MTLDAAAKAVACVVATKIGEGAIEQDDIQMLLSEYTQNNNLVFRPIPSECSQVSSACSNVSDCIADGADADATGDEIPEVYLKSTMPAEPLLQPGCNCLTKGNAWMMKSMLFWP